MTDITERDTIVPPEDDTPTGPYHQVPEEPLSAIEGAPAWARALFSELAEIQQSQRELCEMFTEASGLLSSQVLAMNSNLDMAVNAFRLHSESSNATFRLHEGEIGTAKKRLDVVETQLTDALSRIAECERELARNRALYG